jgi:SAM-dependent methyltransferase
MSKRLGAVPPSCVSNGISIIWHPAANELNGAQIPMIGVSDTDRPDLGGNFHHGDNASFMPVLWKYLVDRFGVGSVLDVGCGEGQSVRYFHRLGVVAHGIDGLRLNVERAVFPIAWHDLTVGPYYMPVDMVNCIEVVEHIEEKYLTNLLDTLTNGRIICMTHAVPGQDGHHHVNCQPDEYWINHLEARGYTLSGENGTFREIAKAEFGPRYFEASGLIFFRIS